MSESRTGLPPPGLLLCNLKLIFCSDVRHISVKARKYNHQFFSVQKNEYAEHQYDSNHVIYVVEMDQQGKPVDVKWYEKLHESVQGYKMADKWIERAQEIKRE